MADIEKVKNGIKNCIEEKYPCASCEYKKRQGCTGWLLKDALSVIEELQAEIARLQPKKGHWEMKEDPYGFFDEIPVCSECGCTNTLRKKTAFCEHCGADMKDGDGE